MRNYFYGLVLNLQFFSVIPIHIQAPMEDKNIERAIRLFPALGMVFGLIYAGSAFLLVHYTPFSSFFIAFLIWLLMIVLCGGIHMDAWMDMSDAFFSYQDKQKRLEIMSDPHVGAFGVMSAIVLLMTKFVLIYEVISNYSLLTLCFIFMIPIFSRTLMGFVLGFVPNAKNSGMGLMFKKAKTTHTFLFYLFYAALSFLLIFIDYRLFISFWCLALVTFIIFLWVRKKAMKWFGGMTGDVVGSATEGMEVILWGVVLLLHYFGMGLL